MIKMTIRITYRKCEHEEFIQKRKPVHQLTCCFGVPNRIITDNGNQITSNIFKAYCVDTGIYYASVAQPRSSGHAERANAEVLKGPKTKTFDKKLMACSKNWYASLQSSLWFIHIAATKLKGNTPFSLVYDAEAVLPVELKHRSPRVLAFDESLQKNTAREGNFLLYHNRYIRARTLEVGDLVLRRKQSRKGHHKFSPMWEGPFLVKHISR
jgi:hypothetical protein